MNVNPGNVTKFGYSPPSELCFYLFQFHFPDNLKVVIYAIKLYPGSRRLFPRVTIFLDLFLTAGYFFNAFD